MKLRQAFAILLSWGGMAIALGMLTPAAVHAAPDEQAAPASVSVPFEWSIQTLRTLEQRLFPADEGRDDHATVQADTHATPAPAPVAAPPRKPAFGPVYVDLVQRVPVRRPIPLASRRGQLASRSGQGYRLVYERRSGPVDISPIILKHAERYRLDPHLVKAVISVESNFRNTATSCAGAQGLMQLMPGTGHSMGARDLYDPEQNIAAGARYLRLMLDTFNGNLIAAVAAYNAGPGNVPKSGAVPNITETRNYVKKVLKAYKTFKQESAQSVSD